MAKEGKPAKEKSTSTQPQDLSEAKSLVQAMQRALDVEVALNRIRDRTMVMQKSEELHEVSELLYAELKALGVLSDFMRCGYVEVDIEKQVQHAWMTRPEGTSIGDHGLPLTGDPVMEARYNAWKAQVPIFHQVLNSEALINHWHFARPHFDNHEVEVIINALPDPTIFYCANFKQGYLHIATGTTLTDEEESLLIRFTQVFAQTYTRFLDLKKVESQTREAEIQLSLERVRVRTMAMQKSDELLDTASLLFDQVKSLGCSPFSVGFVLLEKDKPDGEFFMSADGKFQPSGFIPNGDESAEPNMYLHWVRGAEFYTEDGEGEDLERIRSRTMGMQKTDELKEIVALLYDECNKFGFASVLVILNTRRDEDDGFNWWFSASEQTILPQSYFIPDLDERVLRDIKSIWESGKPGGYIQMGGDVKVEHDRRLFSETGPSELPNELKEMMRSYESTFLSIANMKNGFIEVAADRLSFVGITDYRIEGLHRLVNWKLKYRDIIEKIIGNGFQAVCY